MNKFIKIAFSLIITGIILIGFATYLNNGNIPRFSANYDKKNYTVSINEIKDLDLNILDSDIVLKENKNTFGVDIDFSIFSKKQEIKIKIPKSSYSIDVHSLNKIGNLIIKDLNIKHLTAISKIGNFYLTNVST